MSKSKVTRRGFLRSSAAGAAGLAVAANVRRADAATAWTDRMVINPNIHNLRVVSIKDQRMVKRGVADINGFSGMAVQNSATNIDKAQIQTNLDLMAMALAVRSTTTEAWATIFRRPSTKTWSQVKVAIKVNALGENHPRLAIVDKICRVLNTINSSSSNANDRGVAFANITIFDAGRNCTSLYSSFVGNELPAGVVVSDGGTRATVPASGGNISCAGVLASAGPTYLVDIIVNISCNKGHDQQQNGHATLCMKNHTGSVNINQCPNVDRLYVNNTCDAIVGGTPPRQQLCIVDSLWAQQGGPGGSPGDWAYLGERPNNYRLVMGTFAPAVDYLTVHRVRKTEVVGSPDPHDYTVINSYLPRFGYADPAQPGDPTPTALRTLTVGPTSAGPGWVELTPTSAQHGASAQAGTSRSLDVRANGDAVRFELPQGVRDVRMQIVDVSGRQVVTIQTQPGAFVWDATDASGARVAPGRYVVRVSAEGFEQSNAISVR